MAILLSITLLAYLLSIYASWKEKDVYLYISFFLIASIIGLQNDCGMDILNYRFKFYEISRSSTFNFNLGKNIESSQFDMEIGWCLLCRLFSYFGGFRLFLFCISCFNMFVAAYMITKWVPAKYYWLATFIVIFTPGYLTFYCSGLRQSVAIFLILIAFDTQWSKSKYCNYISFLLLLLAISFHFTSLIAAPFVFLSSRIRLAPSNNYFWIWSCGILILYIFLATTPAGEYLDRIIYLADVSGVEGYEGYIKKAAEFSTYSFLHFGFYFAILALLLHTFSDYLNEYSHYQPILMVAVLVLLLVPVFRLGGAMYRIIHYIDFCCVLAYPLVIHKNRRNYIVLSFFCFFYAFRSLTSLIGFINSNQGIKYFHYMLSFT